MSFDERNLPVVLDHIENADERRIAPSFPWETHEVDFNRYTPAQLLQTVTQHWRGHVPSILIVTQACAHVNRWDPETREAFVMELPFTKSTYSKFLKIGNDIRLRDKTIMQLLPPSYTTLYYVASLNDEEFEAARQEAILNPNLERDELEAWVKERRKRSKKPRNSSQDRRESGHERRSSTKQLPNNPGERIMSSPGEYESASHDYVGALSALKEEWRKAEPFRNAWRDAPQEIRENFVVEVLGISVRPRSDEPI